MSKGTNRKRAVRIGLLALLLVAVGFLVGRMLSTSTPGPEVNHTVADGATDSANNPVHHPVEADEDDPHPSPEAPSEPDHDPPPETLSFFRLVDDDNNPVAEVEVLIRQTGEEDWSKYVSDTRGIVVPPYPDRTECELHLPDDAWRFVINPFRGVFSDHIKRLVNQDTTIRIAPNHAFSLTVEYADGQPYTGRLSARSTRGPPRELETDESGKAVFDPPVGSTHTVFRVVSRRPGFNWVQVEAQGGIGPQSLTITLPASDDGGGLIAIDLSEFSGGQLLVAIVPHEDPLRRRRGSRETGIESGGTYTSSVLEAGAYRIDVRHERMSPEQLIQSTNEIPPGMVWSGIVEVYDGQTSHVRAQPAQTVTARARIVDASGNPVPGALLSIPLTSMPRWSVIERGAPGAVRPGSYGIADEDGIATLVGVLPDIAELHAVARGYTTQVVPVALRPGEVNDLGTVTIVPAGGTITVTIEREDEVDGEYELVLFETGEGVPVLPRLRFEGREHKIEGLPPGRYTVAVRAVDDAVIGNAQNVVLSQNEPDAELVFRMRPRE